MLGLHYCESHILYCSILSSAFRHYHPQPSPPSSHVISLPFPSFQISVPHPFPSPPFPPPSNNSNEDQSKKPAGEATRPAVALVSRKRVNLIDMKRGQNAGIALARIKMSFAEVKDRISQMDDEIFTTDQLRSLSVSAQYCVVLSWSAVLYCAELYCMRQYSVVQYSTPQYHSMHN
jgi:hypothetical protein